MAGRIYIANFGEGNSLWPIAKANDTIITIDNAEAHQHWQRGDRQGFIEAAQAHAWTALGNRPSRQTASRWYNLIDEMRDTEDDIWISRQGRELWWTVSLPGELRETIHPSANPDRDGPKIWHVEKPCRTWTNRDGEGRQLLWETLHPKARDFLSTEATFQSIANDRGYADYARALVDGDALDLWHDLPLFKDKAAVAQKQGGKSYSPRERAAYRMVHTLLETVAHANGQIVERRLKEKTTSLDRMEWEKLLRIKMGEQADRCALTGLPLGYDGESDDKEMFASLDRIDSNGHYTPDNIQIVCRFINRWKRADQDDLVRRLIGVLRQPIA